MRLGAPRAGAFVQARQSIREEALAPLAHDLTARIQASGDLVVVQALGGHQDHSGANDFEIRQRISSRPAVQLFGLHGRQLNREWAVSWHIFNFNADLESCHSRPILSNINTLMYLIKILLELASERNPRMHR